MDPTVTQAIIRHLFSVGANLDPIPFYVGFVVE
jgi:hypothetical protein